MPRRWRYGPRPYFGLRLTRRGLRPYAGIGCWALALGVAVAAAAWLWAI
ncbi:MAG: hypothetical protein AB1725_02960 [Armatimonadota bacterium]